MQGVTAHERTSVRSRSALHTLVLDSLADQVAIIDAAGRIVDLNTAWLRCARLGGIPAHFTRIGSPYLELLLASGAPGEPHVADAARGMLAMLAGHRRDFRIEYPVGSPGSRRWVLMRASRLEPSAAPLFVVSHFDITERRRAEDEAWQLANHDPLTGLANRRRFDEALAAETRRSMRRGTPTSLLEVDVDFFKEYNDSYGHVAGDRCLVRIARVLSRHARRPGDLAARLGGDEFALVLAETGYEAAGRIARELRHAVEELDMCFGPAGTPITVSIGVVTCSAPSKEAPRVLLDAADRALYRAKNEGRNRTVQARIEGEAPRRPAGRRQVKAAVVP